MRIIVYALCFLLYGCGTTGSISLNKPNVDTLANFNVIDARPDAAKQSFEEASDSGKSIYFGDDKINPPAPEIVQSVFQQRMADQLAGKTITLKEFRVNVYEPIAKVNRDGLYQAAATVPDGYAAAPLAELLILAIENMRSEKNVTIQITGDVNGKFFSSTQSESFKGRVTESNIKALIDRAMDEIVLYMQNNSY